ncbi:unnamed protein product, partial [Meganyctiphanes norvegica]
YLYHSAVELLVNIGTGCTHWLDKDCPSRFFPFNISFGYTAHFCFSHNSYHIFSLILRIMLYFCLFFYIFIGFYCIDVEHFLFIWILLEILYFYNAFYKLQ